MSIRPRPAGRPLRRRHLLLPLLTTAAVLAACGDSSPSQPPPEERAVAEVVLSQDSVRLLVEASATLTAEAQDAGGVVLSGRTVTWTTSNSSVASVDDGTVTGLAPGVATVTATSEGVSATARVVVAEVLLAERTIEADSVLDLESDSAEVAAGTLRFERRSGADVAIEEGDILIGSTNEGGGYLRRVTSVEDGGTGVTVQTETATFAEAVDSARVRITVEETVQEALRRDFQTGMGAAASLPQGMTLNSDGTISFSRYEINFGFDESRNPAPGVEVKAVVDGSFAVLTGSDVVQGGETLRLDVDLGFFDVDLFEISATAAIEMDTELTAEVTGDLAEAANLDHSKEVFRKKIFPSTGCAWKGPVCFAVSVVVDAYVDVTAEATARMTQSSYLFAGVAGLGVRYRNGSWETLGGVLYQSDFGEPEFTVEGEAGLRFGLRPNVEIEVYEGFGNASAGVDGAMRASLVVDPWEWRGDVGLVLDGFTDAELTFWGLVDESAEYTFPELLSLTLWEPTGPLVRVEAAPERIRVSPGGTGQVTATAFYLLTGTAVGLEPPMEWLVGDESIATIDGNGVVTGVAAGQTSFQGRIEGTSITTQVGTIVVGDQLALTVTPEARQTVWKGPSESQEVTYDGLVTAGDRTVGGAQVRVRNGMTGQTEILTTGADGTFAYTPAFNAFLTNGVREIVFQRVDAEGYDPVTTPIVREVEKVDPPARLRVGTCLSLDGESCAVGQDQLVTGGQDFFVLFGADDIRTDLVVCGARVDVTDVFTGATTTYTTEAPTCLGAHPTAIPAGQPPGTYRYTVGPARADGFEDGPAVELEVVVVSGGDDGGGDDGGDGVAPQVVSVTPSGSDVSIDTPVQITFSEPMDGATISAIQILVGQNEAGGSLTLDGSGTVVTYTPATALEEFQSTYTVRVPVAVTDESGEPMAEAVEHTFVTEFVSDQYLYRILNTATGQALDTPEIGGTKTCEMRDPGAFTGQEWYFTDIGVENGVLYRHMRNVFGGDSEYLEAAAAPDRCFLTGGGDFTGQFWNLEIQAGSTVRLKSLSHGDARSLGLDGGVPIMVPTSGDASQIWQLARIGPR